jgi:hypothetical protein
MVSMLPGSGCFVVFKRANVFQLDAIESPVHPVNNSSTSRAIIVATIVSGTAAFRSMGSLSNNACSRHKDLYARGGTSGGRFGS